MYCANGKVDLQVWPLSAHVADHHQSHMFVDYVTVFKWPGKGGFCGQESGNVLFSIWPWPVSSQITVDQVTDGWQAKWEGRKRSDNPAINRRPQSQWLLSLKIQTYSSSIFKLMQRKIVLQSIQEQKMFL